VLVDIIEVQPLDGYRLRLRFEDGIEGSVDLTELMELTGIFEPLKDRSFFEKVQVQSECGTIGWPNGADLDPDVLYYKITRQPMPEPERSYRMSAQKEA
jgi:hypothetical protein